MTLWAKYPTKKELKAAVGRRLNYEETTLFAPEYKSSGAFTVVGPDAYYNRKWYAIVVMKDDIVQSVK